MVMDKGLSLREAEDLISISGDKIDFLKLGFGTSMFTPNLKEKVKLYRDCRNGCVLRRHLVRGFLWCATTWMTT